MVATWNFEFNDLTFGTDDYGVRKVEGLDPPETRTDLIEKAEDHGSFVFARYLTHRTITIEGDLVGDPNNGFEDKVTDLRAAMIPQESVSPLTFLIPGAVEKVVYAKPIRCSFPIDVAYGLGTCEWAVQLVAEDPRIYSSELFATTLVPLVEFGIGFDVAFDLDFGGATGNTASAINEGTFPTPPITRIDGPVTNPKVTNVTVDKFLRVELEVPVGQYLILDHQARTVKLGGTASRYSQLTPDSEWWQLAPGDNDLRFDGEGEGGSTLATVSWRSAWN